MRDPEVKEVIVAATRIEPEERASLAQLANMSLFRQIPDYDRMRWSGFNNSNYFEHRIT